MKKKNITIIAVITLIIAVLGLSYFGILPFSIIPDHMTIYDDFSAGFRNDLWEMSSATESGTPPEPSTLVSVSNGELFVDEALFCPTSGNAWYWGIATSKKKFGTDDIKLIFRADLQTVNCGNYARPAAHSPALMYGSKSIPLDFSPLEIRRNSPGMVQGATRDFVVEIRRYDDTDLSKYVVIVDGKEVTTGINVNPEPLRFIGGQIWMDEVKYAPYFSCEIDYTTEVVVRDRFAAGSVVTSNSLTYVATKFCPQDLGVLIFSQEGLTDEKGSITESIATEESLTVPEGQYWQIDYITKYVNDMTERCGVGDAYDTTVNKCVSVAHQESVVQCNSATDCPLPCQGLAAQCISNSCEYSGKCLNPPPLKEASIWDGIQEKWNSFWNWVKSLF